MTLCKVLRDREEARKLDDAARYAVVPTLGVKETVAALNGSMEYSIAAYASSLCAVLSVYGGIFVLVMSRDQRLFLFIAETLVIITTTMLVKQVRDQQDAVKWQALAPGDV